MNYTAEDFLTLRKKILHHIVLNRLLIGSLTETKDPIDVGTSIIWINGDLRAQIKERKGKNITPNYVYANITVSLATTPATIQYYYKDYSPIQQPHNVVLGNSYIKYLEDLATKVCSLFSLNAVHLDKIFSNVPINFATVLAQKNLCTKWWKIGKKGKVSQKSIEEINEEDLKGYHATLRKRLSDWINYNRLLAKLLISKEFRLDNPRGTVKVFPASNHQVVVVSHLNSNRQFYSHIVDYEKLSPTTWNSEYDNPPQFLEILGQR